METAHCTAPKCVAHLSAFWNKGPGVQLVEWTRVFVCSARGIGPLSLKAPHCFLTLTQHHSHSCIS